MRTAIESAVERASRVDVREAAGRCGFTFDETTDGGLVRARFLREDIVLTVPDFAQVGGEPLPPHVLAILVYHLASSDGTPPTGRWISFTDLPDGTFYVSAWRGYTGAALVRHFGDDVEAVRAAAEALGGRPVDLPGDVAVVLDVMPRLPIALVYWAGDEEFEARADFLFDASASRQMATDCLAVCCSWITSLLSRAASGSGVASGGLTDPDDRVCGGEDA